MPEKQALRKTWFIASLIVIVAVVAIIAFSGPGQNIAQPTNALAAPVLGDPNAPLTIVQFADFQCVYCGIFSREIMPDLMKTYVDTGKVKFEWRHFPIFGEQSYAAAHASACAHEQYAFWAYHDILYGVGGTESDAAGTTDEFVDIASSLNLNIEQFRTCFTEQRYAGQIDSDYNEGRAQNVTGTPSFMINGRLFVGAHPIETWHRVLDIVGLI